MSRAQKGSSGFAFSCLMLEVSILAKEAKFFKLDFEVLDRVVRYEDIVGVSVVVVYDDDYRGFVWLVGWSVAPANDGEPSLQGLHEDCEEEG